MKARVHAASSAIQNTATAAPVSPVADLAISHSTLTTSRDEETSCVSAVEEALDGWARVD